MQWQMANALPELKPPRNISAYIHSLGLIFQMATNQSNQLDLHLIRIVFGYLFPHVQNTLLNRNIEWVVIRYIWVPSCGNWEPKEHAFMTRGQGVNLS